MKSLERNHGVSVAWIHEQVLAGVYNYVHTRTEHMSADIFTKPFDNMQTWLRLRKLINIYTSKELSSMNVGVDNSKLPHIPHPSPCLLVTIKRPTVVSALRN